MKNMMQLLLNKPDACGIGFICVHRIKVSIYPVITSSKVPTSRFREKRGGDQLPVKSRLMRNNHQWEMKKPSTD